MCKRIVVRGAISTNKNVERKHVTQMSNEEIDYLVDLLNDLDYLQFTNYSYGRLDALGIDEDYLTNMLHKFNDEMVIEFNTGKSGYDKRVLIRDTKVVFSDKGEPLNVCAVISVPTNKVITLYVNDLNDNHSTINFDYYNEDLKII